MFDFALNQPTSDLEARFNNSYNFCMEHHAIEDLHPPEASWIDLVQMALNEDIGSGDVTSQSTVDSHLEAYANMTARENMTICGVHVVERVFRQLDSSIEIETIYRDGSLVKADQVIMKIKGGAREILTAERVALNFIQHLSGIATKTSHYCSFLDGLETKLLDTRKTTPGWRLLEKYAVLCGGGTNHRGGLFDMIMIKDNHLQAIQQVSDTTVKTAVERARSAHPNLKIEVEADDLSQVRDAIEAGADIVLLDNMSLGDLKEAVELCKGICQTEASGGITEETIRQIAESGVDFISSGALTHSARNVDIGLDFQMQMM